MKRIYRSTKDKKLGGICGGLGEYLNVDPTIIRLLTVVVALCTAIAPIVIGYIIAWIIIPEAPVSVSQ